MVRKKGRGGKSWVRSLIWRNKIGLVGIRRDDFCTSRHSHWFV